MTFKAGGTPWNKGSNKVINPKLGGRIPWNKGKKAADDPHIEAKSALMKSLNEQGRMKHDPPFLGRKHTEETKLKISTKMSHNNKGGRCKWYDVSGQKVQGTWERDVALKLDELSIKWKKLKTNKDVLQYNIDGNIKSYTPDFLLIDLGIFLEIKGYWWGNDKNKMIAVKEQHPDKRIVIIEKREFEKIMQGELVW